MSLWIFENPWNYTTQRMNPKVNYGLQIIVIYQYWSINYNKYITLMQNVNNKQTESGVRRDNMRTLYY